MCFSFSASVCSPESFRVLFLVLMCMVVGTHKDTRLGALLWATFVSDTLLVMCLILYYIQCRFESMMTCSMCCECAYFCVEVCVIFMHVINYHSFIHPWQTMSCCWVLLRDCTVNQWWFTQNLTASELASCPLLPVHFIRMTIGVAHCAVETKFPYKPGQSIWLNSCDSAFSWPVGIIYKK